MGTMGRYFISASLREATQEVRPMTQRIPALVHSRIMQLTAVINVKAKNRQTVNLPCFMDQGSQSSYIK